jgi:FMN-dependent NADH-azoreductase
VPHLFRLDASINPAGASVSRELADRFQTVWEKEHPGAPVTRREVGLDPLPAHNAAQHGAARVPEGERTPEQAEAVALGSRLGDELLAADAYLFAVPLYNWTIPAGLHTWFDWVLTDGRLRVPGQEALAGRPAVVVHSRGGGYGEGTPRAGWDHAEPYVRRVLEDVLMLDVTVVTAELTLAGVVPAMAHLQDLAAESLRLAHRDAEDHARRVAELVVPGDGAIRIGDAARLAG